MNAFCDLYTDDCTKILLNAQKYTEIVVFYLLNLHLQISAQFCEGFHETSCRSLTLLSTDALTEMRRARREFHYRTPCGHTQTGASMHAFTTFQPIKTKPRLAVSCALIHWADDCEASQHDG